MALPVELEEGQGTTRDVSLSGVFFETGVPFRLNETIKFILVFEGMSWSHTIRLECEGRVVRIQPSGERVGVAATIASYRFAPQA